MPPRRSLLALALATLLLGGCATVSNDATQPVDIVVLDAAQRPVEGMRCRARNGDAEYFGNSPLWSLKVRRSGTDLKVECRRGNDVARGTVVSRVSLTALQGILPGGVAMVVVDHVSGYAYSYPATVELRIGEHLVFDPAAARTRGLQAEVRSSH